jgi:hypothetical protein
MTQDPRHVTAAFAIAYVHWVTNGATTLTTNRIRVWAHRDRGRVGTDPDGYALYDLDKILERVNRHAA